MKLETAQFCAEGKSQNTPREAFDVLRKFVSPWKEKRKPSSLLLEKFVLITKNWEYGKGSCLLLFFRIGAPVFDSLMLYTKRGLSRKILRLAYSKVICSRKGEFVLNACLPIKIRS